MTTTTTLYAKNGELVEALAPSTVAIQVVINDEDGNSSNVEAEIVDLRKRVNAAIDAGVHFKGVVNSTQGLPTVAYKAGWQYAVEEAGTYAGQTCEVGDLILCIKDYASGSASSKDWTVLQANIDGAVTGDESSVATHVAVFDGTSGKKIKDSGYTLGCSVPADAVFTDTTYKVATDEADGLLSAGLHAKLTGIEAGADVTDTENVAAAGAYMKATDTADSLRDGTEKVVMTAEERSKLARLEEGAWTGEDPFVAYKVGNAIVPADSVNHTLVVTGGEGITASIDLDTVANTGITISETYVDSCVVTSLDDVPANLRDGGLVILKGA